MEKKSSTGPVLIIIAALLWAFDGLIRQHLYTLPPITIIFFEHLIGLIILSPFVLKYVFKAKLASREWWLIMVIAILSGLLGTLWFTTALGKVHFISISVVFLLQKLQPIFAISTASIFLKEKLDKRYIKWAILALIAAYFVTFPNGIVNLSTGEGTAIAALYALGAAFAWGSSTTFSKMLLNKVDSKVSTFYRFLFTLLFALPFVLFFGRSMGGKHSFTKYVSTWPTYHYRSFDWHGWASHLLQRARQDTSAYFYHFRTHISIRRHLARLRGESHGALTSPVGCFVCPRLCHIQDCKIAGIDFLNIHDKQQDLLKKKCVPCEDKSIKPLSRADAEDYTDEVFGWTLDSNAKKIFKEYKFQDFIGAINFVERVADVAEMEQHHPDIHIHYNKVFLELWTHNIGGLSENDFILAAKVDAVH